MKILSVIPSISLILFFSGNCLCQQTDIEQLKKSAEAYKKKMMAQYNIKDEGLPAGYENSWKVMVIVSRTAIGTTDISSTTGGCKSTKKSSFNFTISSDFSSDSIITWQNGDDFTLITNPDNKLKPYMHPFKGMFTVNSDFSGQETSCDASTTTQYSGGSNINATGTRVGFSFNRKSKKGNFQVSVPDNYTIEASGKSTYKSKGNPSVTVDASGLGKAQIGSMMAVCGIFQSWNYAVSQNANYQQAIQSSPVNGGMASIGETKFGYDISYSESKTVEGQIPDGWTGSDKITYTTSVHILITNQDPPQYDAIIELVSAPNISNAATDYAKWIPQGPPPPSKNPAANSVDKGNSIAFDVYLIDKKKPDQRIPGIKYDVDFKLTDVSIEPGYCNNYPLNATDKGKKDLKFDESLRNASHATYDSQELKTKDYYGENFIAVVTSFDYGSFGKLTAMVTLEYGSQIPAHFKDDKKTVISLPKDDNNNQVADEWEKEQGIFQNNYSTFWDGETQDNNNHDGDGLTLYEEYRGIMAKGKHKRLNPNVKDLIIANTTSQSIDGAMQYFSNACKGNIVPVEVKAGDELDIDNPIVNKNSNFAKMGDQYGIVLKMVDNLVGDNGDVVLGQAFVKNNIAIGANDALQSHIPGANEPVASSPKDVNYLGLSSTSLQPNTALFNYSFAHELGHCLAVQHHGNSKMHIFDSFDRYLFQQDGFVFVDEDGKQEDANAFLNKIKTTEPPVAALPGSQASGDDGCIMCYNQEYEYSFPKDVKGKILIHCNLNHPNGTYFCTGSEGKGRNDKDKKPRPVFGDATTGGSCMQSIQVKDW